MTVSAFVVLALAFAGHLVNVVVLEPGLGFETPADYYDASRMLPVLDHWVWKLGAAYHLLAAIAILMLACSSTADRTLLATRCASAAGAATFAMFVFVAMTNVVGMRELENVAALQPGEAPALYGGMLVWRATALAVAIIMLGIFLLVGNALRTIPASGTTAARTLGLVAGTAWLSVPLAPALAPIAFLSTIGWGLVAAVQTARTATKAAARR